MDQNDGTVKDEDRLRLLEEKIGQLKAKVESRPVIEDRFFDNPVFSDFRVKVGQRTFHVTKYHLARASPVFERMFLSCFKEATDGILQLQDDPEAVEFVLKYMYMKTRVENFEMAREVVVIAHRYEMNDLVDECELVLFENVCLENARETFLLANDFDLKLLLVKCGGILYYGFDIGGLENCLPEQNVADPEQ
ncbi:unnamed protein product [Bursaphelenchus xylophilus]|uniref:(pine wood nematode) hypothetical protein n=1 Tax=Bursaphelenchus xylophilus TaxID=6326 RepID=A0A1I7S858_BURXY|nr:unnamed protein product [Bursaphelenchus xylophilus]CAG9080540.1 unnamed protein product [Bursaphelenchus xylophilus]